MNLRELVKCEDTNPRMLVEQAKKTRVSYDGLRAACLLFRQHDESLPLPISEYVADIALGVQKKPRKIVPKKNALRDGIIRECIRDIAKHTDLAAQRAVESEKVCAISILSEASGLKYATVEEIWKGRNKEICGGT